MPSDPSGVGTPQRLHPASALFALTGALRSLFVPILLLLVFSRGSSRMLVWYAWGLVPVLVAFGVKYASYRYRLDRDELVIREGILTRNERHVPYARIQNIDVVQNPLHRLFGVAEARLETASGGEPEAAIRVLSVAAVDEMRRRVFAGRAAAATGQSGHDAASPGRPDAVAEPASTTLLRLSPRDLVIHGLISNRGLVVVAAAFGLASQAGLFDFDEGGFGRRMIERSPLSELPPFAGHPVVVALAIAALVVATLALVRLLSVALTLTRLAGFTLTRRGADLRLEYGLLTRVSATIPSHRIQSLAVEEGPLHRLFGKVTIRVETAGGANQGDDEGGRMRRQALAPVIGREQAAALVREVLPEVDLDRVEWRPVEWRAWRRRIKPALALGLAVTVAAWFWSGWPGLAALPLSLGWAWISARRGVAALGFALAPHAVLSRSGWIARRVTAVTYAKMQVLDRAESPFDRRHGMAAVGVDTAGGGGGLTIPYLDASTADTVLDGLYLEAGRRAFRW